MESQNHQTEPELAPELAPELDPDAPAASGSRLSSRLIGKILSPAIRLWLRTQLEAVDALTLQISGSDRQILSGEIPGVAVAARQAVYRGLHLSQAQLQASQIRVNLRQVMQGKPLRLLEPVPVLGQVCISQADLDASMAAPLLRQALADLWQILLQQIPDKRLDAFRPPHRTELHYANLLLDPDQITLITEIVTVEQRWHLLLRATVQLATPACLELNVLQLEAGPIGQFAQPFTAPPLRIELGDVQLERLVVEADQIICEGQIIVQP